MVVDQLRVAVARTLKVALVNTHRPEITVEAILKEGREARVAKVAEKPGCLALRANEGCVEGRDRCFEKA